MHGGKWGLFLREKAHPIAARLIIFTTNMGGEELAPFSKPRSTTERGKDGKRNHRVSPLLRNSEHLLISVHSRADLPSLRGGSR